MLNLLTEVGARPEDAISIYGPGTFLSNLASVVTDRHHDMLRHLVAQGSDLEEAGFLNMRPLHLAAEAGDLTAVQILVEGNADVNALSGMNKSPLCLATENGHVSVVKYLLEIGANTDSRGSRRKLFRSPLIFYALYSGNLGMLKTLLAHGVELDVTDYFSKNSPLHSAILEEHVDMIQPLVEAGASINAINRESQTPLELAESIENKDAVRALAEAIQNKV